MIVQGCLKKEVEARDRKERRLTAQGGYSAGLVGTLDSVATMTAEVAADIADDTADAKVLFFS